MRSKTVFGVIAVLLVLLCLGCSTKNVGLLEDPGRDASRFTLNVDAASFFDGASAEDIYISTEELDTHMLVSVNASGASGLKALYFELEYDPESYRPMTVAPTEAMGGLSDMLTLQVLRDRGSVHYGQVVTHPDWRVGASGDVTLATVSFRKEPCPPARMVSDAPNKEGGRPVLTYDDVATDLNWHFASLGDYNQDSEVGVSDLTPLGVHYNEESPGFPAPFDYATAESVIDGNSDGLIGLADISTIGQNFAFSVLGGWNIYGSDDAEDAPADFAAAQSEPGTLVDNVGFATGAGDKNADRLAYTYDLPDPPPLAWYWVIPVDNDGNVGYPSLPMPVDVTVQPILALTNPPAGGSGTAADPWIMNDADDYIFSLTDPDDGDVSTDVANTVYNVSAGAGTIDTADATLNIEDAFEGDFTVTATYMGKPNRADTIQYCRVLPIVVGLYIMPDDADTDWDDVVGSGVVDDEYVMRSENPPFNVDYLTEFSLVANSAEDGTGDVIDVATLDWDAWPPFAVQDPEWTLPGTFQANADGFMGANSYIHAMQGVDDSNWLYVTSLDTLP